VTAHDCQIVSGIHIVRSGSDMAKCVGNFDNEFVGRTEQNKNITKLLSRGRITLISEAPVTRD